MDRHFLWCFDFEMFGRVHILRTKSNISQYQIYKDKFDKIIVSPDFEILKLWKDRSSIYIYMCVLTEHLPIFLRNFGFRGYTIVKCVFGPSGRNIGIQDWSSSMNKFGPKSLNP